MTDEKTITAAVPEEYRETIYYYMQFGAMTFDGTLFS
jgi:hypothetical protein